jgi:hypothetical protein
MKNGFWSLAEASVKFAAFAENMKLAKDATLSEIAILIRDKAKASIGHYSYNWPPLADSTIARKSADTPLLETGALRDSIEATVFLDRAYVGSNDQNAVYQELGTSKIPPRSFLLSSALASKKDISRIAKKNIHAAWIGNHKIFAILRALHLLLRVAHELVHTVHKMR